MIALDLIPPASPWRQVDKFDTRAAELADRHYSRQSIGNAQFMAPGRTLILIAEMWTHAGDARAVWGAIDNLDPAGARRFRCTIFRNETPWLSSLLIIWATQLTLDRWQRRGWLDSAPPYRQKSVPTKMSSIQSSGPALSNDSTQSQNSGVFDPTKPFFSGIRPATSKRWVSRSFQHRPSNGRCPLPCS